eukprot:3846127-Rhodomonas_salina.8
MRAGQCIATRRTIIGRVAARASTGTGHCIGSTSEDGEAGSSTSCSYRMSSSYLVAAYHISVPDTA